MLDLFTVPLVGLYLNALLTIAAFLALMQIVITKKLTK